MDVLSRHYHQLADLNSDWAISHVQLDWSRHGPPFRAAPRTDPDMQSYRIRLLCPVFGIEA